MSSVHPFDPRAPTAYLCAQTGCQVCLERLLHYHERLIHAVIRRQYCGAVPYADLLQEGRIALWQALRHFDPCRGCAFATYAWVAIQRAIWRAVAQAQRPHGYAPLAAPPDPFEWAAAAWQQAAVRAVLPALLAHLPEHLQQVLSANYGLDGWPPCSLAELGRHYGVSRERVRQWRNDALVRLRLPALSGPLRRLCDQQSRAAYQQALARNRTWLRQRRGGRR
jgi:RNA polymerase sigma factor (sigma-70 family)